jgi:hypothetical protein
MANLSSQQKQFLAVHKISPSLVFDGSGLSASDRKAEMKRTGRFFYFGGSPCREAGHTLRTKSGHCIQCDTSKISFQLRSAAAGYVYLACSPMTQYIKVGFSEADPDLRTSWIQQEGYGNIRDWEIDRSEKLDKDAGRTEFAIHAALAEFQHPVRYEKTVGLVVECREIFKCSLAKAREAFELEVIRARAS